MVEATRRYNPEYSQSSWSGLKDLAQIVGTDDARTIYDKLATLQSRPLLDKAPPPRPRDDEDDDAEQGPNEVYILALATALQRAPDAPPCRVEARVRQVLRQLGMCLETCRTYFVQAHAREPLHDASDDSS